MNGMVFDHDNCRKNEENGKLRKLMDRLLIMSFLMLLTISLKAQEPPKNWFGLDPVSDQFNGVSTEKAYAELLAGKTKKVIVAVMIQVST